MVPLLIGVLAGAHIATWGMYKDAPHEGYSHRKYVRAIVLAGLIALVADSLLVFDLMPPANAVVFFGCIYAAERGLEELYKTFLREEDQAKYFIPMQFHVLGRVVHSRLARWSVAAAWLLVAAVVGYGLYRLQATPVTISETALVLLVGGVGGWLSAVGGAAKDAPIEGFDGLKFLRSPLIATGYGYLLGHLTSHLLLITFGAIGYTVATIETYKTFGFPNRPRGKFAGKPILYPEMLQRRQWFIPIYLAIWIAIVSAFVLALTGPHHGRL